jgi:hypothetical protein
METNGHLHAEAALTKEKQTRHTLNNSLGGPQPRSARGLDFKVGLLQMP